MVDQQATIVSQASCPLQQVDVWTEAALASLARQLGRALPSGLGEVVEGNGFRIARLTPRRLWIIGNHAPVTLKLEDGAVLPLGEGRVCLELKGHGARHILAQLMAIDWEDQRAAPDRIVQTGIHRVPVAVLPLAADHYELLVPRSFAESIAGFIGELQPA